MDATTDTDFDTTPRWSSIGASGPEAGTFLQGQVSQDLDTVTPSGAWSLLLAPDGTLITSLFITATADGFDLAVPRELADAALTRLRRFLLRTACTLTRRELDRGPYDSVEERIDAGRPGPAEFARELSPQCFGGSFVASTVSFTKGCFTGQELVARLDARGSSVPWRLARVRGPSVERLDEVLRSKGPASISGVTTSTRRGECVIGLGFAHRTLFASDELAAATDVTIEEIA